MIYEEEVERVVTRFEDPKIKKELNRIVSKVNKAAENFSRRNRVTKLTIYLMLSVALLFDLAQAGFSVIPFVGWILSSIVGIYAWLTFYVWGSVKGWSRTDTVVKKGINWISRSKPVILFTTRYILPFLELIPILGSIPGITLGAILTILIIKSDDFIYNRSKGKIDAEIIEEGIEFFRLFREV